MSEDLYREIILDYYRHPRNYGSIENPDIKAKDSNPLCGDVIEIQIQLDEDNQVEKVRFNGKGCAISQASASILTEMVQGKSLEELREISKENVLEAIGSPDLGHTRIKCALLSLKILKTGVYSYLGETTEVDESSGVKLP